MRRVLWIDDDQRLLTPAAVALGKAGLQVEFASDLAGAIDALKAERWDHVVVDVGIAAGDLEARHPETLDALGFDQETTGLTFAAYLLKAPAPLARSAESITICSGFQREFLESVAPDAMAKFGFVSKASKAFLERHFIADLMKALGLTSAQRDEAPSVAEAFDLPYLDLYHDLKAAARSSLPGLRRVSERLHEYAGGKQVGLDSAVANVETLASALVDEAFVEQGVTKSKLEAVEDVLADLSEKRTRLHVTGYVDLTRLGDKLALTASRLPRLGSTQVLLEACRALQSLLCAIEIDKVSDRLLSELSVQELPDASGDACAFDASAILANILDSEEPNALANRAGFDRHIQSGVLIRTQTPGQAHLYRRALTNIIDNAIKYQGRMPENNTWIIVRHSADSTWCTTSVEGWGPPIPPHELHEIFRAGRRGERARKQGEGRGLTIAEGCIRALGGWITPKSELGRRGNATNTFTVRVPLAPKLEN